MGFGEKNLLMLAPGRLVREASTGSAFVTPSAVVTAPPGMVFVRLPFTVIVTLRVKVQLPRPGRLPPVNEKEFEPGVPLSTPPQIPTLKLSGLARIIPLGISSVKAIPVSGILPGLINWTLIVEAEPPKTVKGSKPLTRSMAGAPPPVTVKLEVRLLVGTRFSLSVMFAGGMVLVNVPDVLPVTKTSILQRWPARIKPPVREIEVAPVGAFSAAAAPQPLTAGGVELLTVTPAGRLSVTEKFVRFVSLGAKISILNRELPPAGIVEGENDFVPATSVPVIVTLALAGSRFPIP